MKVFVGCSNIHIPNLETITSKDSTNTLKKGMNPIILFPAMGK